MMKLAIPTWDGKISPVFDVARNLLVVNIKGSFEVARQIEAIPEMEVAHRARRIARFGVDVLICGAISRPLERMLVSEGIQVIPQTCGPVEDVLLAFLSGQLTGQAFLMPGCCGRHRKRRGQGRRR
ncbi:MAG: NifB/NifX family molybdenum-iron cluster-binding protein [Syntrophaceae bacterium]|nr:NifB/NifX family molybdenum-iron cluster-binding protein [Syntrophaceae bacterium]